MKSNLELKQILKNFAVLCLLFVSSLSFACPGDNNCSEGNNLPAWAKPAAPVPEVSDIVKQSIQSILSKKNIMIQSLQALGQKELLLAGTSINAGGSISLGIPTVILPSGRVFEGFHSTAAQS